MTDLAPDALEERNRRLLARRSEGGAPDRAHDPHSGLPVPSVHLLDLYARLVPTVVETSWFRAHPGAGQVLELIAEREREAEARKAAGREAMRRLVRERRA